MNKIRNDKIIELYLTGDFKIIELARMYKLSSERVRQLIVREIGKSKFDEVKQMKKERTAERWKENYLAGLK